MVFVRIVVLGLLALFSIGMGFTPPYQLNAFGRLVSLAAFLLVPALYLLPTYEAWRLDHPNLTGVALVNVFLGWSLIGWIVALVWALKKPEAVIAMSPASGPRIEPKATRDCPFCAETVLAQAIKCKHCGSDLNTATS